MSSAHACPDDGLRPLTAAELFGFVLRPTVFVIPDDKQARAELLREDLRADRRELAALRQAVRDPRTREERRAELARQVGQRRRLILRRWRRLQALSTGYLGPDGELITWPGIPEGAVPVVNPKGTGETGADRPAAPIFKPR